MKLRLPIATLDILFERDGKVLYGFRKIPPYRNVWAFPGGRILFGEKLSDTIRRVSSEYGLKVGKAYLVGVFPITFRTRSDVPISVAAPDPDGEPRVDGFEFSSFAWLAAPPKRLGANYRRMLEKWRMMKENRKALSLHSVASSRGGSFVHTGKVVSEGATRQAARSLIRDREEAINPSIHLAGWLAG